jgi:hypothetical protein
VFWQMLGAVIVAFGACTGQAAITETEGTKREEKIDASFANFSKFGGYLENGPRAGLLSTFPCSENNWYKNHGADVTNFKADHPAFASHKDRVFCRGSGWLTSAHCWKGASSATIRGGFRHLYLERRPDEFLDRSGEGH